MQITHISVKHMKAKGLNFLASVSSSSLFMSVRMVRLSISSVLIMRSHKISFSVLSKYVVCPKLLRTKTDYSSNIACSERLKFPSLRLVRFFVYVSPNSTSIHSIRFNNAITPNFFFRIVQVRCVFEIAPYENGLK